MKKILSTSIFIIVFCLTTLAQSEPLPCPKVSVTGPSSVLQSGEKMTFTASVLSKVKLKELKYNWNVDKGIIITGQNTNTIQVSTEGLSDTTITAAVEVELPDQQCESIDSETGVIAGEIIGEPYEDYGKLPIKEELWRFEGFLSSIYGNESSYYGFVVIHIKEKEISPSTRKRLKMLAKNLDIRKFSRERIIFGIEKSSDDRTYLWIVPPGAKTPKCENCEIIRASEIN